MVKAPFKKLFFISFLFLPLIITACLNKPYLRHEVAQRIGSPAFMIKRTIPADPFLLTVYERMHQRHAPANVYIEGDGMNWLSPSTKSLDPTPTNPVALHLAAHDKAKNVVWMARPCQYTKLLDEGKACDNDYWTGARYAPEVITSMNNALNEIKRRYNITEFNLIGFSGGGAVAAILAATRDDITSLRTVAGNLDHEMHSQYHNVTPLYGSLNAIDYAHDLADMPQHHFIGGQDEIVPPAILHSYLQAIGPSNCVHYSFIQEAEHEAGIVEKWPTLLNEDIACEGIAVDAAGEFEANVPMHYKPAPAFKGVTRPSPSKP